MAIRNRLYHPEEVRQKIQASQIINRLNAHIKSDKPLMEASQVAAAKILLGKVIPDLKAIELGGKNGGPVQFQDVSKMSDDELSRIASAGSSGTTET